MCWCSVSIPFLLDPLGKFPSGAAAAGEHLGWGALLRAIFRRGQIQTLDYKSRSLTTRPQLTLSCHTVKSNDGSNWFDYVQSVTISPGLAEMVGPTSLLVQYGQHRLYLSFIMWNHNGGEIHFWHFITFPPNQAWTIHRCQKAVPAVTCVTFKHQNLNLGFTYHCIVYQVKSTLLSLTQWSVGPIYIPNFTLFVDILTPLNNDRC